jgi:hypothetical protein
MTLPTSQRKADVFSKLEYAEHRRNAVMDELFSAKKASRDPKFIIHAAAEVVATARETFDYLGQDIVEQYLLPNTKNAKIKKAYASGKLKVYFPFHEPQVKESDGTFHELKTIAPSLYSELLSFVEGIAAKHQIANTLFNYGWFMNLKDMVNEKKHDRLLALASDGNQEILVEGNGLSMLIPKKKQQGWNTLMVQPGMEMKDVTEYRFAYNNVEVADFCLFAAKATEIVVGGFYRNHFAA